MKQLTLTELRSNIEFLTYELQINWKSVKEKQDELAQLQAVRTKLEQVKLEHERTAFPLEKALASYLIRFPELLTIPAAELRTMFKERIAIL